MTGALLIGALLIGALVIGALATETGGRYGPGPLKACSPVL